MFLNKTLFGGTVNGGQNCDPKMSTVIFKIEQKLNEAFSAKKTKDKRREKPETFFVYDISVFVFFHT